LSFLAGWLIRVQRSIVHVLLSLLLLLTQQVSLLHGFAHSGEARHLPGASSFGQQGTERGGKIAKLGLHDLCSKCAASAQVAFALPTMGRTFLPVELAFSQASTPRASVLCLPARCVFQSRAPPSA
jgi:hypothetical protein